MPVVPNDRWAWNSRAKTGASSSLGAVSQLALSRIAASVNSMLKSYGQNFQRSRKLKRSLSGSR